MAVEARAWITGEYPDQKINFELPSGPKGDKGDPGNATMRVDTSVGTRVFISDGTTEHMLKGDTGWRDIRDLFVGLNDEKYSTLELRIKRVNDTVYLRATIQSSDNNFSSVRLYTQSLVHGFKLAGNFDWPAGHYLFTFLVGTLGSSAYMSVTPQGGTGTGTSAGMRVLTQWETTDAWPTTLPGTPV